MRIFVHCLLGVFSSSFVLLFFGVFFFFESFRRTDYGRLRKSGDSRDLFPFVRAGKFWGFLFASSQPHSTPLGAIMFYGDYCFGKQQVVLWHLLPARPARAGEPG